MNARGNITGIQKNINNEWLVSLRLHHADEEPLNQLSSEPVLDISIDKPKKRRSLNANALLWKCLGDIAADRRADKWEIYLEMLKRYGQYTYIVIKPKAYPMLKRQWRECEQIGEIDIHGERAIQCLCYYGSSTYDSKEFSVLLDGVISEMKELGLETPMPEIVRSAIEEWEKRKMGEGKR